MGKTDIAMGLLLAAALLSYGSAIWAAFAFFKTGDVSSKRGQRLISMCAGSGTLLAFWLLLTNAHSNAWLVWLSLCTFLSSAALFWWTWWTVRRHRFEFAFSTLQPAALVVHGPYRWVRHPFYSAYVLGWVALVIAVPQGAPVLIAAGMWMLYWRAARVEERTIMSSSHGAIYAEYSASTGMFLPLVRPAQRVGGGGGYS